MDLGFKPDDQVMKAAVLPEAIFIDNSDMIEYLVDVDKSLKTSQIRWQSEFSSKTVHQLHKLFLDYSLITM